MTPQLKRREFFKMVAGASAAYYVLQLTACGPAAPNSGSIRVDVKDGNTVTMYDMVVEGWSTLGSGHLGDCDDLSAQLVQDNKTVTLAYTQDDHGHQFTLTPDHFAKLRRGEKISLMTTEALGHHHEVRIDPKKTVRGSRGITMPIDPLGSIGPGSDPTRGEKAYAALTDSNKNLYVSSTVELDEASVQYCVDTPANCDTNPTLWQTMKRHAPRTDKQIFVSERDLSLDSAATDLPLSIRGKSKTNAQLLQFMLKLVRR